MTIKFIRAPLAAALLAATATGAMLAAAPAQAADEPKVSRPVGKLLMAAQTAEQTKDWKTALDDINQAKALSDKTPFDDYKINQFAFGVEYNMQDLAAATAAAQAAADSPAMPESDKASVLRAALVLSVNAKQYPKAITYAKQVEAMNPTEASVLDTIGQAYYLGGDMTSAKAFAQKRLDAEKAAGQKPDRNSLQVLLSAQVAQKDEAGAEQSLEALVANYNDPNDWQQMLDIAFSTKGLRDVDAIWLGRLLFLCGATVSPSDASMIGSTASHLTFFGDAQVAQQHGGTGFPDAGARADADKKTIAAQIAAVAKQNGTYSAKLAEALYSYGMYPQAEETAQASIAKGGNTQDPSEAPMVLGQAQAAQGKYDDALASFAKVTGGGPATPRIVRLWVDYVNLKKNPPAAAATASAAPPAQTATH